MKIRRLQESDVDHIRMLHERYYPQFEFPDFFHNYLCRFAITDSDDSIVIAGGVEPIAEAVLITDQAKSEISIGRALIEAQRACMFACGTHGITELHAFTDNPQYAKHLQQHGFSPRSQALSMKVPNGKG